MTSRGFLAIAVGLVLTVALETGSAAGETFGVRPSSDAIASVASSQRRRARRKRNSRVKSASTNRLPPGTWGGPHVRLQVRDGGAEAEFDCAQGEISSAIITDANGRFDVAGTFAREGGHVRVGRTGGSRPARYTGRVNGRTMTLTIKFTDSDQTLETFTLTRDSEGRLWKCR